MKIELSKLSGLIGYKGASYKSWDASYYKSEAKNDADWSGLYIALDENVAQGYLPDMVPSPGNGKAYIHKVSLDEKVNLITCLDDSFKTGKIDIDALKSALSGQGIVVKKNEKIIPKLGKLGYLFKCFNNEEGAIEIIVPNNMVDKISMSKYKECQLKNYTVQNCS
ncbi:hypothetical protein U2F10_25470 [Leptothoe sp. EHU-05/26/07-4]